MITKWSSNPFIRGAWSYARVNSSAKDCCRVFISETDTCAGGFITCQQSPPEKYVRTGLKSFEEQTKQGNNFGHQKAEQLKATTKEHEGSGVCNQRWSQDFAAPEGGADPA